MIVLKSVEHPFFCINHSSTLCWTHKHNFIYDTIALNLVVLCQHSQVLAEVSMERVLGIYLEESFVQYLPLLDIEPAHSSMKR